MLIALTLLASLGSSPAGPAPLTTQNDVKHPTTEKAFLAAIDREIAAAGARLPKPEKAAAPSNTVQVGLIIKKTPAGTDSASSHFEMIDLYATQVDSCPDFQKKPAETRQREAAALKNLAKAAHQAASISHSGSAKEMQDAYDLVKECRAEVNGAPAKKNKK